MNVACSRSIKRHTRQYEEARSPIRNYVHRVRSISVVRVARGKLFAARSK